MKIRSSSSFSRAVPLLLALTAVTAPRGAAAEVVARIGGTEVSSDELRSYVKTLAPAEQAALAKDPALLSQVARAYLARQAVLREAQTLKYDQRPEVSAQLDRVRDQALTELYLQAVSRPPDAYPDDGEVRSTYDANRGAFEVPRQYRLAQVFIAVAKGGDKDEEQKARRRLDEVKRKLAAKGSDFAAIAKADSDEKKAAERGGEIGWLAEAQMIPGIRVTVAGLAKGVASEPVRLDDGWHILQVLDVKAPFTRSLAEVREGLRERLRAERAQANRQGYLTRLLEQNPPAINELALSKVLPTAH